MEDFRDKPWKPRAAVVVDVKEVYTIKLENISFKSLPQNLRDRQIFFDRILYCNITL